MSRRALSYRAALQWLADNDDTSDIDDAEAPPLISWCLVADIYGRTTSEIIADLRKLLAKGN